MNTEYDVIVLGTGLKECMLAGLLAKFPKKTEGETQKEGAKILQLDRNGYYGSDSASLILEDLWKHFRPGTPVPSKYGESKDWNVDLIPKYVMASGNLVKILLNTNVSEYLEWKPIDRIFLYQSNYGIGDIHKIPVTPGEAIKTKLFDLPEKRKIKKLFDFIKDYEKDNPSKQNGITPNEPFGNIVLKFGLQSTTVDFVFML